MCLISNPSICPQTPEVTCSSLSDTLQLHKTSCARTHAFLHLDFLQRSCEGLSRVQAWGTRALTTKVCVLLLPPGQALMCELKDTKLTWTHGIDARQLHADVDHSNSDDLPAHAAVLEQTTDREGLDGGQ